MAKKGSKFQKYSLEFKIDLVEKYLRGEGGGIEALALKSGLKSDTQLRAWVKKYQAGELTEAGVDMRKYSNAGKGRKRSKFTSAEEELEYLRLENEYLKKKRQSEGMPEEEIARLWSSKNRKDD